MSISGASGGQTAFMNGGLELANQGTGDAAASSEAMMANQRQMAALQMKQQQEMGLIQMLLKLSEALAKMFKALGEAVKGLVG